MIGREEAGWKSSSNPKVVELLRAHLGEVERGQFDEADSSGQRLARLGEQLERGGAEQQEASGSLSFAASRVYDSTQRFEQSRCAVDLVENHKLVRVILEIKARRAHSASIGIVLEIEVDGGVLLRYLKCQRRLADLTRPHQRNGRGVSEPPSHV